MPEKPPRVHLAEVLGWTSLCPGQNGQWLGHSPHSGAFQLVPAAEALIAEVRQRLRAAPVTSAVDSPALQHVPQQLYNSEINFGLSCFYADGFAWSVMVNEREPRLVEGRAETAAAALLAIAVAAARQYPNSAFARWWADAGPGQ